MQLVTNRNIKTIEGILNLTKACFGAGFMSFIKYALGWARGGKKKKENLAILEQWASEHPEIPEKDKWLKCYKRLMKSTNDPLHMDIADAFYNCDISLVKEATTEKTDPIVICIERNELTRMHAFMAHYRALGVKSFYIVDNSSTDGTYEYLMKQDDVTLFSTETMYTSQRKAGWLGRAAAYGGFDHWYIQADADELLEYQEDISLLEYVSKLKEKKITSVRALMLELYPAGKLGSEETSLEEYIFFDADSDEYIFDPDRNEIKGGFLSRVFEEKNALQCKTPLYFQTEKRFSIGSHHIYPFREEITTPYTLVLKHYKFIPGDEQRIREAVDRKNYANGSRLYNKFIGLYEGEGINCFYEGSRPWIAHSSVKEFPIMTGLAELNAVSNKKILIVAVAVILGLLSFIVGTTWAIDPLFHYHGPVSGISYTLDQPYYTNDGISRHFDYDMLVTGSSTLANTSITSLEQIYGNTAVKVTYSGGSFKTIGDNLKRALRDNEDVTSVIYGVDMSHIDMDADYEKYEYVPRYITDDSLLNDVSYLLNKDIFIKFTLQDVYRTVSSRPMTSFDDYDAWYDAGYEFGAFLPLTHGDTIRSDGFAEADTHDNNRMRQNVQTNIVDIIEANPDVEFVFAILPVSIINWAEIYEKGELENQLQAISYFGESVVDYDNVSLYCFCDLYDVVNNPSDYRDEMHFGPWINELLMNKIHDGEGIIRNENELGEYIESIRTYYESYDYAWLYE